MRVAQRLENHNGNQEVTSLNLLKDSENVSQHIILTVCAVTSTIYYHIVHITRFIVNYGTKVRTEPEMNFSISVGRRRHLSYYIISWLFQVCLFFL